MFWYCLTTVLAVCILLLSALVANEVRLHLRETERADSLERDLAASRAENTALAQQKVDLEMQLFVSQQERINELACERAEREYEARRKESDYLFDLPVHLAGSHFKSRN